MGIRLLEGRLHGLCLIAFRLNLEVRWNYFPRTFYNQRYDNEIKIPISCRR